MNTFQDKLSKIEKSDQYPFHMPGHKRAVINPDLKNPCLRDITEIDGYDNLHSAKEFILEEEKFAAELFGADESYYLINGSSCGILAGMLTVSGGKGDFLVSRNSHKSVFNGLYLTGKRADYLYPMMGENLLFGGSVSVDDVKEKLSSKSYAGVLITSPTYEGVISDIRSICDAAHDKKIPVIVDEAHGAHLGIFGTGDCFPKSALQCGADLVIQSTHKTLPAMTQTALLHVKGDLIDREKLRYHLTVFQSSSPSYILMESISDSLHYCKSHREALFSGYSKRLAHFYKETKKLNNLYVFQSADEESFHKQHRKTPDSIFQRDAGKLVICIKKEVGFTGKQLYDLLREKYRLQLEMAERDYVIAMTSVMDTDEGFFRLIQALYEIDKMLENKILSGTAFQKKSSFLKTGEGIFKTEAGVTIRKAMEAEKTYLSFEDAIGKYCGEFVYLYPPGIPVLIPGEMITREQLSCLKEKHEAGFSIQGAKQFENGRIACIKNEKKENISFKSRTSEFI